MFRFLSRCLFGNQSSEPAATATTQTESRSQLLQLARLLDSPTDSSDDACDIATMVCAETLAQALRLVEIDPKTTDEDVQFSATVVLFVISDIVSRHCQIDFDMLPPLAAAQLWIPYYIGQHEPGLNTPETIGARLGTLIREAGDSFTALQRGPRGLSILQTIGQATIEFYRTGDRVHLRNLGTLTRALATHVRSS